MNTSSDGVFTRNAGLPNAPSSHGGHYSMRSFLLLFLKKPISSGSLQRGRLAGSHFLNLPIRVIGCLLIININCVVRCEEALGPPAPCPGHVNYQT